MEQPTLVPERIFTEEEAARFLRKRQRRRWATRMVLGVLLLVGVLFGPAVLRHVSSSLWLTALGAEVHWDFNEDNWKQGGVTSVWFPVTFRANGQFENRNVADLRGLHRLESLDLSNTFDVSALGLAHLKDLPYLKVLDLNRVEDKASPIVAPPPKFSDDDLVHLEPLFALRELHLAGNPITDEGLVHLSGLKKLEVLNLEETNVTGAGLRHLKGLMKLKELRLGKPKYAKTAVDPKAAAELNAALPDVVIHLKKEYELE